METVEPLLGPILLQADHNLDSFDCGVETLNVFLRKHTLANNLNRSARTYVVVRGAKVAGYYTSAAGSVNKIDVLPRIAKSLGNYPVPIVLLARLAVDLKEKGQGLGKALMKDALLRTCQVADLIGCRALLVHAKDSAARAFYEKWGFEPSPIDDLHLYLLMKDVEASIKLGGKTA